MHLAYRQKNEHLGTHTLIRPEMVKLTGLGVDLKKNKLGGPKPNYGIQGPKYLASQ